VTTISVVMCSIDAAKFAAASASYERALAGVDHEIVGIHDARSLAEGYNRGIDRARGDIVVFSHDDVEILSPDLGDRLRKHLDDYDVVGIAGTTRLVGGGWYFAGHPFDYMLLVTPHPETGKPTMLVGGGSPLVVAGVQALDGVFIAARGDVACELRFDAATFDDFHLYDLDFTFRAFLAGKRLAVCRDVVLVHHSQGSWDAKWDEQRQRFERKFAGRLAAPLPYRRTPVTNVPLDDDILADPAERARLCNPETLSRFVASVDRVIAAA
jgi:glycosyltransferase involved in cell wall biosynthesis